MLSGSGATRTYTPNANVSGTDAFTFTVNDGTVTSAAATVSITITAVNDLPTISNIADRSVSVGQSTGPISFTVGDIETAAGSLTLSRNSSNLTLVPLANIVFGGSGAARTLTVTPAAGQSGTATITVTVADADGGSASDALVLTVTGADAPPVITVTPVSTPEGTITINATITDDRGAPTITWIVTSGTAVIDNPAVEDPVVHFPIVGNYQVSVTARDSSNQVTTATVAVTVTNAKAITIRGKVLDDGLAPNPGNGVQLLWTRTGAVIQTLTTATTDGALQFPNLVDDPTTYQVKVLAKP